MTSLLSEQQHVLRTYGRAVVHMRQQIEDRRFGLVLGAGATMDLGFPSWPTLIERIAEDPQVDGGELLKHKAGNTSNSQLLFEAYRAKVAVDPKPGDGSFNRLESRVRAGWQRVVHDALYRDVPKDSDDLLSRDRYLAAFLPVITATPLTINYNFDDTVQRMLDREQPAQEERKRRSYSTVWNANIQMFPRDGVIYHPNGYLPMRLDERPSEQLVFLEDTFADQLIHSMAGHYVGLSYHLAQATRLLLGLSLADPTLKHLLRQNALCHPGHYHYYVAFVPDGAPRNPEYEQRVSDANFAVYNLITLFLTAAEISALAQLLRRERDDFRHFAEEVGVPSKYLFLLTGSVGVGKSTMVSQFRSLRSYDEWLEPRRPGMEKDPSRVDSATLAAIDEWVYKQLNLKNVAMLDAKSGIHIVDRAPLDAFAFAPKDEWKVKAQQIRAAVAPGQSKRRLVKAHVILMVGDPEVMAVRAISKHKETEAPLLQRQQEMLKEIYSGPGVTQVDTRDKAIAQVVKDIARIIHKDRYSEMQIAEWLDGIADGTV